MRESIRCDFLSPQGTQERADEVAVSPRNWLFRLFSRHIISRTQKIAPFIVQARVDLYPTLNKHTHDVTLAAHARRGLITGDSVIFLFTRRPYCLNVCVEPDWPGILLCNFVFGGY